VAQVHRHFKEILENAKGVHVLLRYGACAGNALREGRGVGAWFAPPDADRRGDLGVSSRDDFSYVRLMDGQPGDSCPSCGAVLDTPHPNFCPNCGAALREVGYPVDRSPETVQRAVNDLGRKLEECVEKILRAKGYKTQLRQRIQGSSGVPHEIDIVAERGPIKKAVECKNWERPAGKENIQKFVQTLDELGRYWNGVFVAYGGFTQGARDMAEHYGIELWDYDYLKEEYWAVSVGRAEYGTAEESIVVKNALPLNTIHTSSFHIRIMRGSRIRRRRCTTSRTQGRSSWTHCTATC